MAVDTYVQVWNEPDPALRATMIEACFAAAGRIVTRSRDIVGRPALAEMVTRVRADPQFSRVRLSSAIDAVRSTFRFSGVTEHKDGSTSIESFDAGEIDASGRIAILLTFAGPLAAASHG
jgi:hypothetical protein